MSQSHIQALVEAQYKSLTSKDNKERLRYTVAGCKDGKLYDHAGTNYGVFNEDAADTEFITDEDLSVTRLTGARLSTIAARASKFFEQYGTNTPSSDSEEPTDTDNKDDEDELTETDELIAKFKKAIKKGKTKKARKLLSEIGEDKKLSKMLKKLEAEG